MSGEAGKLARVLDGLEGRYGKLASPVPEDPYELVVFLNCGYPASDEACAKGFAALKTEVGLHPAALMAAEPEALAEAMRPGGMVPEVRAQRLKQIAAVVQNELGGDLRAALLARPAKAKALLKRFPTLGEPAAERILLFCGVSPEPAAPAGGLQVFTRLGLSDEGKDFTATFRAARAAIAAATPDDFAPRRRAYLLLKTHGHRLCKRSAPLCEQCPVTRECAYFRETSEAR